MGREVRKVPQGWLHPRDGKGEYRPLFPRYFFDDAMESWRKGEREEEPKDSDYMPDWPTAECTHWQMYEDVTEGTPISPPMESAEALAQWLADNGASAMGRETATYEQWLRTIRRGWACSMVVSLRGVENGVAADM